VVDVGSFTQSRATIGDADIRRELIGEARAFFRGLLLTIGALDVLERGELPVTIVEWCALALTELHATANVFRASGLPVPTDVVIPGYFRAVRIQRKLVVTNTHDIVLLVDGHPGDPSREPRPLPDGDPWRA